jgi:hypothetical protein
MMVKYYPVMQRMFTPVCKPIIRSSKNIFRLELEELNFSCQLNETNEQIAFYWSNFTSSSYTNLTISLATGNNKLSWMISCDPYLSQGICSTKQYQLEPGTEYQITAKLEKVLPNYNGEKLGTCSIKTSKDNYFHQNLIVHIRSESNSGEFNST